MTTTTAITYVDGKWVDANAPLWSSMSHGVWLSSMIFDGARAFEGVTPDLDLHCQRAVRSAGALGLRATMGAKEIEEIARDGVAQFSSDTALYIRPMFWAEVGFVAPDPDSTKFALTVNPLPMPGTKGFSACHRDAGQCPMRHQRMQRHPACIPMRGAHYWNAAPRGSITVSCWTRWAMLRNSPRRTCSWPRMAW